MAKTTLDETVKTRISGGAKKKIEAIAASRELGLADVIREAIRDYINRNDKAKAA